MVSFVAVLVTNTLIRDYMINCARSFIYTTSTCYANTIVVDSLFDLLEQGASYQRVPFRILPLSLLITFNIRYPQRFLSYRHIL